MRYTVEPDYELGGFHVYDWKRSRVVGRTQGQNVTYSKPQAEEAARYLNEDDRTWN